MVMALNADILKARLKEAFGSDSQETVGKKLNMTQGNISKLLSGSQQPTLETVYHIAEIYDVSVDWLLGKSETKRNAGASTYASCVETLFDLNRHGAIRIQEGPGRQMTMDIADPIIAALMKKSLVLSKTDEDLHRNWVDTKLSLFGSKPLIFSAAWVDHNVEFLASEATTESNWLEVYEAAKKAEEEYSEMMGDDVSPFNE